MNSKDKQAIRQLVDDYLYTYATCDGDLTEYLSEDFSSVISITDLFVKAGEVYPLQKLTDLNRILEKRTMEQAKQLSEIENQLEITKEKLAQEIDKHRLAVETLSKSEAHFRMMTESAADVVWRLDSGYRFTYISPSDEKLRGYCADEVIGQHVFEMFDEEGIALIKKAAQRRHESVRSGEPLSDITFEAKHRCKDGGWIWGEICSTPELDCHGKIIGFYGISREITERKQRHDQVRQLAFYDPLTRLPNRHLLNDRLSQTMAVSKRKSIYGALMFLDLDNFKPINDTHGHRTGDLLLVEVAQRLIRCMREVDTVARFGGDEFIVVLSELKTDEAQSLKQAYIVAEKIRTTLAQPYQITVNYDDKTSRTIEHSFTVSIGVALFLGQDDSLDDLLKRADISMYRAKGSKGNSIRFYNPAVQSS